MGLKQHAHVCQHNGPLTPLWECYDIETCEMWEKEEMVCVLLPISWVEVFCV
jgi:hypothetical protein